MLRCSSLAPYPRGGVNTRFTAVFQHVKNVIFPQRMCSQNNSRTISYRDLAKALITAEPPNYSAGATALLSKRGAAEASHPSVLTDRGPRTRRGGFCPVHIGAHNQWRAWPPLTTVPSRIGMLVQPDRAVP